MLDSLVATQKENNVRLAAIEKSVNALVSINKKTEAREKLEAKRAASLARRDRTKRNAPAKAIEKKEEKQKKKSFLDNIIDALKGPVMVAAGIGLVVAALSDPKVQQALGRAIENLKPVFKDIAVMMGTAFVDAVKAGLQGMARAFLGDPLKQGGAASRRFEREAQTAREEMDSLPQGEARRQYMKDNQYYDKLNFKYKHLDEKVRADFAVLRAKQAELDAVKNQESEEKIKLAKEKVKQEEERRDRVIQALKEANVDNKYKLTDEELKEATEPLKAAQLKGMQMPGLMGWLQQNLFPQSINFDQLEAAGFQQGGSIQVPGSGDGDKVPAILPAGSFVMNKIATSAMGYQEGGIPVMLEPGERVFGPGSWGPAHMMMNSIIPRFQEGGKVDIKQSEGTYATGPGWQPDSLKDYKGRPIIVSKEAAIAIMKMYNDGKFKGSDVTSSQRSPGHNSAVGGVPNSKHLGGNALDVSTGSSTWHALKNDGSKYGWNFNNYMGPQGWHFDFVGGGGSNKPGKEKQIANQISGQPDAARDVATTGPIEGQAANELKIPGMGMLGNAMNTLGASAQQGARGAGLPGLADMMHMYSEGFRQSKAYTVLPALIGGIANFATNFISSLTGGLFGGGSQAQTNQPSGGGFMPSNQGGGSALERVMNPFRNSESPRGGGNTMGGNGGGVAGGAKAPAMGIVGGMGFSQKQWDIYRNTLAKIESGGVYDIAGGSNGHYDGRYQLGADAKTDAARILGIDDPGHGPAARAAYRGNPEMQEKFFAAFTKANHNYLMRNPKYRDAKPSRKLEILGYAHNQGMGGAEKWLNTGRVGTDGFGTKGTAYSEALKLNFKDAGMQNGGVVNMSGSPSNNMRRYEQAMDNFKASFAEAQTPIIVPVPMGGGGGGNTGGMAITGSGATPPPPDLPSGPQVVALLELQNRLALGAAL